MNNIICRSLPSNAVIISIIMCYNKNKFLYTQTNVYFNNTWNFSDEHVLLVWQYASIIPYSFFHIFVLTMEYSLSKLRNSWRKLNNETLISSWMYSCNFLIIIPERLSTNSSTISYKNNLNLWFNGKFRDGKIFLSVFKITKIF